jgi:hypothetical protein
VKAARDTRRRAALDELVPNAGLRPQVEDVLKTLADARLISTSSVTAAEEKAETPRIAEAEE